MAVGMWLYKMALFSIKSELWHSIVRMVKGICLKGRPGDKDYACPLFNIISIMIQNTQLITHCTMLEHMVARHGDGSTSLLL